MNYEDKQEAWADTKKHIRYKYYPRIVELFIGWDFPMDYHDNIWFDYNESLYGEEAEHEV